MKSYMMCFKFSENVNAVYEGEVQNMRFSYKDNVNAVYEIKACVSIARIMQTSCMKLKTTA